MCNVWKYICLHALTCATLVLCSNIPLSTTLKPNNSSGFAMSNRQITGGKIDRYSLIDIITKNRFTEEYTNDKGPNIVHMDYEEQIMTYFYNELASNIIIGTLFNQLRKTKSALLRDTVLDFRTASYSRDSDAESTLINVSHVGKVGKTEPQHREKRDVPCQSTGVDDCPSLGERSLCPWTIQSAPGGQPEVVCKTTAPVDCMEPCVQQCVRFKVDGRFVACVASNPCVHLAQPTLG